MKFILNLQVFFLGIVLIACQSDPNQDQLVMPTTKTDTIPLKTEDLKIDTNAKEQYEAHSMAEIEAEMTEKYGTQWDFCDCIYKTDSINTAISNSDHLSESDFEALMTRFEIIDQHCKTIIASPNTTPREREAHEAKVKRCKTEMGL